ncbi:hypothetical protein [Streptomyces albireticuli]|uniref:Uncharacterized protein n=1 Tax=Streptomyces albireticuli TaxID=1940 RepID=A0A2A2D5B1_9ACTN|nr:hypothetical protein [Streptomyces albireticuli]MCD9196214.1 hypothetical protein [Streptomyces albireticuli]PAU46714.1 hypothetical protein CK936_22615 [Streptomyces albireticuli]
MHLIAFRVDDELARSLASDHVDAWELILTFMRTRVADISGVSTDGDSGIAAMRALLAAKEAER